MFAPCPWCVGLVCFLSCVCKRDSQNRTDRLILIEKRIRHQTKKLACAFSSSSSCVCGEGFSSSCVRDLRRASFTFLPLKWTVIAGCRRSACPGRPPAGPALRQCRDCFLAAGMLRVWQSRRMISVFSKALRWRPDHPCPHARSGQTPGFYLRFCPSYLARGCARAPPTVGVTDSRPVGYSSAVFT